MRSMISACVLVSLLFAHSSGAVPASRRAFQDLPRDHHAYAVVDRLEQQGISTGYPARTFRGKRALTRYEFAIAIQRMLTEVQRRPELPGVSDESRLRHAVGRKLGLFPKPTVPLTGLRDLVREFSAELAVIGMDTAELGVTTEAAAKADPGIDGAELDVPPRRTAGSAARRKGTREAREEWEAGRVTYYTYGGPLAPGPSLHPMLGVPFKSISGCIVDTEVFDRAAGHNEEVYRLCLERGLPPNSLQPWAHLILHPNSLWAEPKCPPVRLDFDMPQASSPDARVHLRLTRGEPMQAPTVRLEGSGRTTEVYLAGLLASAPSVEVLWSPAEAGLVFLRYTSDVGGAPQARHLAVRVKTGEVLGP